MKKTLLVLFLSFCILLPLTIVAKNQPLLTVAVLKTETVHWTTYWNSSGSPGKTNTDTDCDVYANSISCSSTSTTTGQRAASTFPLAHMQVNILVKMPDGNAVEMQCHSPVYLGRRQFPVLCFEPRLGTYQAAINEHNIHLMIPATVSKPKYNKDGTLKQPAKTGLEEVKFSFR
jgi:hypothetical protein